ncbi:minor tail protein [Gordonia Phage StorminNorm]|nr:minor tail protein [Gordonia Phage StorminNorm]WMI33044.1 minor tail protein [Gordonia Phage SchottB]
MGAFATKEAKAYVQARAARAASVAGLDSADLLERCNAIWEATKSAQRDEARIRREVPIMRLWDAEWLLQHVVGNPIEYEFEWIDNDAGAGMVVVLAEDPVGQWALDFEGRDLREEGVNVHITADYVGARWGGRMEDVSSELTSTGDEIVTITFMHDIENLKWIECFPSPFLPAITQFKAWMLLGPVNWCALTTLHVNLMRDETPLTLPDDPLDPSEYLEGFDVDNWQIAVNPISFMEAMNSGVVWGLPIIRMKYWYDAFIAMIEDAELSIQADRWLEGDDLPYPGADPRNGQLIISLADKSGRFNSGTSHGGNLFGGLVNTIDQFTEDFLDTTRSVITGQPMPNEYMRIGYKSTNKALPYVVLRPGVTPGVISAKFTRTPEKTAKIITGGKSAPGVNEGIGALIQAIGDIVGDNISFAGYGVGSIGGAIDTLLRPIYEHTILAWTDTKSFPRAQKLGWSRYVEFFQEGADQAYTLNSLMVIRTGLWATRRWSSHEVKIVDSCPWMLGDNGVGHMWVGDRIASTRPRDQSGIVFVERIKKVVLGASEEEFHPEWTITIGSDAKNRDPFEEGLERIRSLTSGLHDVGII